MANFADLILGADTRQMDKAVHSLDDVVEHGAKAEKATDGVGRGFDKAGNKAQTARPKLKGFSDDTVSVERVAKMAARSLGVLAAGFISVQAVGASVTEARAFNAAISETSTLIEGTPQQLRQLEESARSLGVQFGTTGKQQVEAFYQAISAGAGSVSEAATLLETANKLAVGGVTDVTTAVDILTTVLDTFGHTGVTAASASDTLFTAMQGGKTTVGEMSASLGKALPFAAKLGLSFEETAAAAAALTRGGISTAESVTGLRAAFTAILAPGDAAKKLAADLGIAFNESALESQNFAEFMADVVEKTGGGAEALQTLFGSVEAMNAALALSGPAGEIFTDLLGNMDTQLGATQTAFEKVNEELDGRLTRSFAALGDIALGLGKTFLPVLVVAMESLAAVMTAVSGNLDVFAVAIGVLAASQIPALLAPIGRVIASLTLMEAQFIAGAVAARGMAIAMNLLPGVAIFTGVTAALTATYRAYGEARASAEEYAEAAEAAAESKRILNEQLGVYIESRAPQAKAAIIEETQKLIENARASLMVAEANVKMFETHRNGLNPALRNTEAMQEAQARSEEYKVELENLRITLSAMLRDNDDNSEGVKRTGDALTNLSASAQEATAQVYAVIPSLTELREEYGASAEAMQAVLQAQNELAAADASAGFSAVLSTVLSLNESLDLGADKMAFLKSDIEAIGALDTFGQQSRAIAQMAAYILEVSGGLDSMDDATRAVYQALLNASAEAGVLGQQIAIADASSTALGAAIARIAPQFAPAIVAANNLATAVANIVSQMGGLASGLLRLSTSASAVANVTSAAGGFMSGLSTKVLKSASTGLAGVAANLSSVFGESQKSGTSVQSLGKHLNNLVSPSGSGGGGGGGGAAKKLSDEAKDAAKSLKEAEAAAKKLEDQINRPLVSAIDGMANALGDFVASGLRDIKSLGEAILNTIRSSISQAIAFAIANPIKIALGLTGGLSGGAAQAATGGLAGAPAGGGGGILGLGRLFGGGGGGGLLGSFFGSFGGGAGIAGLAGGTGLLGGVGNVIGGFASGGLSGALGGISTSLSGITTGISGLGAAIGAIAVPVLAVAAIFSFFKKKVTQLDSGLRLTIDGLDTLVETFRVIETKRFWGLSKKVRASYAEAEDEVSAPLQMIVGEIQGSILRAAESLGIGSDAFNDFAHQITVSTQGLSDEDAQQAIQDALEELGDEFAGMVEGLSDFQRVSEGSAEAITRMSTSLLAVNDAMDLLGGTLFDVSLRGGDMASFLVDAFGGIEQMAQAVNTYFAAFYSQEEQRDTIMRRLNDRFADLGQIMPQSREGFRQLVESMDLTTEYGRELYAALVSMAGAMDQVLPQVERFTMSMQGLMTRVSGEIGGLIEQSQELASASGEQARLWYRTAKSLREFLMDISNSSVSPLTDSQKEIVNRERFEQALADSLAGNQEAAALLPELAREYLDSAMSQSQTLLEYQAIAAGVMNQLKLAAGVADLEGANEDVTQALYERQIEILTALANFLELESLTDEQLASLGTEIQDLAANWDATIAEFDQALMSLETAIRDAEDFSYSQLQERLNVSVNLLAEADIPEYLKNLIATAETGVEAFIDFVIRDDQLTPDQKWLLANRFSTHFNEIEMALSDQASNSLALKLALRDTFDSLIIFDLVLNPASNKMVEHLATVEQSLHHIGVNVDLSNHPDPLIRALAEYRTSVHEARVRAKITANSDSRALQMVGHRASNHQINAGVDLRGSVHNGIRRMGFRGVSNHKINTGVDLRGSVHDGIRRMGFDNTSSHRIKTQLDKVGQTDATLLRMGGGDRSNHRIKTHLDKVGQTDSTLLRMGGAVRSDHRIKTHLDKVGRTDPRILRMGGGDVSNHLVNAGIDLRGSVHTLIRRMGASGKTNHTIEANLGLDHNSNPLVRKMGHYRNSDHTIRTALELAGGGMNSTIMQVLNNPKGTYELDMETYFTDQQQDLLDTLLLGPSGTVTIGGQFEFEPSQLFSNWFEGTVQSQIATPMSNLSDMLNELRVAVVLDTQQRQEEMARQDQIANLQRWGAMASDRLQQGVSSAADAAKAIRDLEKSTNVSLMTGNQMTDLALNPDGTINYDATSVMMGAGSNIAAFNAAFRGPNGLEAQLYAANDSIVAENAMVQELARRLGLLGVIPAFASGGTHMGGVARVGENDMELVAPSRIYNPTETRQMLMGGKDEDVVSELRALRMQFARAEADRKNDSGDVIDYMKKTATTLQKFDVTGLPPERNQS